MLCAARIHVHRAALAALLAVGAILAMDAANSFFLGWLLCARGCLLITLERKHKAQHSNVHGFWWYSS